MDVLLHSLIECWWVQRYKNKNKKYADTGTRTSVARFRTVPLSRFNGLGCLLRVRTLLSLYLSLAVELAGRTPGKINDV